MYGSVWSAAFQPCKKRAKILKWRQMRAFSGSVSEWCGRAVAARFLPGSCPTAGQEPPRSGGSCAGAGQQPPHHSWVLHHPCADLQVRTLPTRPKEGKPNDENDAGSTDTFVPRAQAWSGGRSEPPAGASRQPERRALRAHNSQTSKPSGCLLDLGLTSGRQLELPHEFAALSGAHGGCVNIW